MPARTYPHRWNRHSSPGRPSNSGPRSWSDECDSKQTVLRFYEKELAGAERTTNDDGSISFKVIPAGAETNEYVTVTVDEGELRIGEHCRPGKIKS